MTNFVQYVYRFYFSHKLLLKPEEGLNANNNLYTVIFREKYVYRKYFRIQKIIQM